MSDQVQIRNFIDGEFIAPGSIWPSSACFRKLNAGNCPGFFSKLAIFLLLGINKHTIDQCSSKLPLNRFKVYAQELLPGLKNRILHLVARIAPGAKTWRVKLHRWRGVNIGKDVWIGYDTIIETGCPHLVTIGDHVRIGIKGDHQCR